MPSEAECAVVGTLSGAERDSLINCFSFSFLYDRFCHDKRKNIPPKSHKVQTEMNLHNNGKNMNTDFDASQYKSGLAALMAAKKIINTLTTREEIRKLKDQIKDTWSFDKWEHAAPLLNGIANMQIRKINMERKSWQLCIDLEFHFHGTKEEAEAKVKEDKERLEELLQVIYCGSGLEYQPTNYTIKLNGEIK